MKQKIYEFSLFLKDLYFVSKGSLNIPEHRRLFMGRVLQLYTMKPVLENIALLVFNRSLYSLISN